MEIEACNSRRDLFDSALSALLGELSPERAFVAYKESGAQEFEVYSAHGLEKAGVFTTGEVSLEVLKRASRGEPVLVVDAGTDANYSNRTSVILSGLRSILCAPIKHPSGLVIGILYADNRIKAGAFKDPHLQAMNQLADRVCAKLLELGNEADSEPAPADPTLEENWQQHRKEGFQLLQAGQLDQALEKHVQALGVADKFGKNDLRRAKSLGEVAELYARKAHKEAAETALIEAKEIFENNNARRHPDLAGILNNLAGVRFRAGHQDEAEEHYRRALEIWEEHLGNDDGRLATVYFNLAKICLLKENSSEASTLLRRAYEIAYQNWGEADPRTQKCKESLDQIRV